MSGARRDTVIGISSVTNKQKRPFFQTIFGKDGLDALLELSLQLFNCLSLRVERYTLFKFVVANISYRHPLWFVLKAELLLHKVAILD